MNSIFTEIDAFKSYFKRLPEGIDIGLRFENNDHEHDKILLPCGGFTTFVAPTKHGKTQVLLNAVHSALGLDKSLQTLFVTLEELKFPILMRLLNLEINETLSKNNIKALHHYFKRMTRINEEWQMFDPEYIPRDTPTMESMQKRARFKRKIKKFKKLSEEKRFGIIDFTYEDGSIGSIEYLCSEIERLHQSMPNLRLIAIDYIQLLSTQGHGRASRDEMLKEVCLQLKDVAAKTGIAIITAAQFNRKVLNEDSLVTSAIGEAASIERQSSMVIGMWNRTFQQYEAIGKKSPNKYQSQELMLKVMLNRYGPSGQEFVARYDGNIGKVDFGSAREVVDEAAL